MSAPLSDPGTKEAPALTGSSRAEEQLLLLTRASSALLSRPDAPDVLEKILHLSQQFVAADAYAVWRRESDEGLWRAAVFSGLTRDFEQTAHEASLPGPLPSAAMAFEDVFADRYLAQRWEGYRQEGIKSMLTVPLTIRGSVTGTVVFYYRTFHGFTEADMSLAMAVGNLAAAAIDISELYWAREKLREEAEDERRRAVFLAKAGAVLASSLDVETTLKAIADLAIPDIADWCTIDLVDSIGMLRRVSVRSADPERMHRAEEIFRRYPVRPESPLLRVLETGESVLIEESTDEMLRAGARSPEHYEAMRDAGLKSAIFSPLHAHGETLGLVSLFTSDSGRRYSKHDVPLVEELAARAAVAVHGARLHQAVRESAERLRISAAAAGLGIFEWNPETGEIVWENPRIYEIFGRSKEEGPLGESEFFRKVLHPDDSDAVRQALMVGARPGCSFQTVCRIVREDGELRTLEFAGLCDLNTTGTRRLLGVVADITERKRLEDRLREAAKLESIGVLAGGVAHDFNNLLTGIMGNASLALETLDRANTAYPMIELVMLASERAAALTRQLLAYSGRGKFVLEDVDLSELMREIAALVRMSIPKTAQVRLDLADRLPEVPADPAQMQQLAMNLVINAAESLGGEPGTVAISTGHRLIHIAEIAKMSGADDLRPGRYVWLEVGDNGCGMTEATLRKIFDPFFSTKFTGRGLGLSAVQGIVRGHRGAIQVESAPGRGSSFRVLLPAKTDAAG